MKNKLILGTIAIAVLVTALAYIFYRAGVSHGAAAATSARTATVSDGKVLKGNSRDESKTILYWHDPMVPGQKFDKPGKSPFMDMPLVPVYAGAGSDEGGVSISARTQQNLGIRTAALTKATRDASVLAVGGISFNERDEVLVQARASGYVARLLVRARYDRVRKGQPLAELYVADWVAAQEEYLAVRRMGAAAGALLSAARQRMQLAGMDEAQIGRVEALGKVIETMTITAPTTGVVTDLNAREGMAVSMGAPLFRINGTGTVWVNAEVPESQIGAIGRGAAVQARTAALPDKVFEGTVSALLPEVNPATRTLKARIEIANPGGQLVPGMFVTVVLRQASSLPALLVPSEAIIQTGSRSVVMVAEGRGKFHAVDVEAGTEANGMTEIRTGLTPGQQVVVSGQFLIDSEASLKGATSRMAAAPSVATGPAAQLPRPTGQSPDRPPSSATRPQLQAAPQPTPHRGEGTVEHLDDQEITLSHGAIPTLGWGAMTMGFKIPAGGTPPGIRVGDRVAFSLRETGDGAYQVVTISRSAGSKP